jgi:hypothetical protein
MKQKILAVIIGTVVLFLWSGLTQMFPWGVPTAQTVTTQSDKQTESFQSPNLVELPPNSLTTNRFDEQFQNKISTLTTDETFSWIISKPISYYNVGNYFLREIATQLIVAILLVFLLSITVKLNDYKRILLIGISALLTGTAVYGQQMNWWGIPALYAVGASVNLVIGWLIVAYIATKFIIKTESK